MVTVRKTKEEGKSEGNIENLNIWRCNARRRQHHEFGIIRGVDRRKKQEDRNFNMFNGYLIDEGTLKNHTTNAFLLPPSLKKHTLLTIHPPQQLVLQHYRLELLEREVLFIACAFGNLQMIPIDLCIGGNMGVVLLD